LTVSAYREFPVVDGMVPTPFTASVLSMMGAVDGGGASSSTALPSSSFSQLCGFSLVCFCFTGLIDRRNKSSNKVQKINRETTQVRNRPRTSALSASGS